MVNGCEINSSRRRSSGLRSRRAGVGRHRWLVARCRDLDRGPRRRGHPGVARVDPARTAAHRSAGLGARAGHGSGVPGRRASGRRAPRRGAHPLRVHPRPRDARDGDGARQRGDLRVLHEQHRSPARRRVRRRPLPVRRVHLSRLHGGGGGQAAGGGGGDGAWRRHLRAPRRAPARRDDHDARSPHVLRRGRLSLPRGWPGRGAGRLRGEGRS